MTAGELHPKFEHEIRKKPHKRKSEIRISKFETNWGQNKSKTRKIQNLESDFGSFGVWIAWII